MTMTFQNAAPSVSDASQTRNASLSTGPRPGVISPVLDHGRTGIVLDRHAARRVMTAVGLAGIALIHVLDLNAKLREVPYIGWMYIGLIVSALLIAEGLIRTDDQRLWLAAGALAAAAAVGYSVSRITGLPGDHGGDLGNWLEPLGLASLMLEGIVVLFAVARLSARRH